MTKQQRLIAGFLAGVIILGVFLMLLKGDEPANTPETNPLSIIKKHRKITRTQSKKTIIHPKAKAQTK